MNHPLPTAPNAQVPPDVKIRIGHTDEHGVDIDLIKVAAIGLTGKGDYRANTEYWCQMVPELPRLVPGLHHYIRGESFGEDYSEDDVRQFLDGGAEVFSVPRIPEWTRLQNAARILPSGRTGYLFALRSPDDVRGEGPRPVLGLMFEVDEENRLACALFYIINREGDHKAAWRSTEPFTFDSGSATFEAVEEVAPNHKPSITSKIQPQPQPPDEWYYALGGSPDNG